LAKLQESITFANENNNKIITMSVTHRVAVYYEKESDTIQLWSYDYHTLWQQVYWEAKSGTVAMKTMNGREFAHMKRNVTEIK
jgi:hypothetical protein